MNNTHSADFKQGNNSSGNHPYNILIDRNHYQTTEECMAGRDILKLAGKIPIEKFQLNVRYKGGKVSKVGYDEIICFSNPGIEKFMTLPLDQTEGSR